MVKKLLTLCLLTLFTTVVASQAEAPKSNGVSAVTWVGWSDDLFAKAKAEHKLVLLDLEAIWCHWCHVMDAETYSNKEVQEVLAKHYIAVKVDQDSRPDLSNMFKDWGWPATIIFNAEATPLAKRAGFVEPAELKALLVKLAEKPEVEKEDSDKGGIEFAANPNGEGLPDALRNKLIEKHYDSIDAEKGGLKTSHKYVDADTFEYSLIKAAAGSEKDSDLVKKTLDNALQINDQVWGGFYQYSTGGEWNSPHFEKIMNTQANNLRLYSLGFAFYKNESYHAAAQSVFRYATTFLKGSEGAFYTSQDADLVKGTHSAEFFALNDAERKAKGIPAIDKNMYARENGWIISALASLYAIDADAAYLNAANTAAQWIIANRSLPSGGFKHGEKDAGGPYLADSLAMARAFLSIYMVTGDRAWLQKSENTAQFIISEFLNEQGADSGLYTSSLKVKSVLAPKPLLEENIEGARYFNLLSYYAGKERYKAVAKAALKYLAKPEVALENVNNSGVLLADQELGMAPLHLTIVGKKDDVDAQNLFAAASKYYSSYKRIEWWDKREGNMPNPDVTYPELPKAAAFICTNSRCSLPIFAAEKLDGMIKAMTAPKKG